METDRPIQPAATIEAGLEALARGDWEGARSAFSEVVQVDETPEALEGLGMVAKYIVTVRQAVDEFSYSLHVERRERPEATEQPPAPSLFGRELLVGDAPSDA